MAFSFQYTRYSSIGQILLGGLCIIFGIADRATMFRRYKYSGVFHTQSVVPIWMGVWILITGIIGFAGSNRIPNSDRPSGALIGTYLGFSVVSVVFAGVIIIMYSMGIAEILRGRPCSQQFRSSGNYYDYDYGRYVTRQPYSLERQCNTSVGLGSMIIICAVLEFGVGIWACICCCSGGCSCCDCCQPAPPTAHPQMGQVVYIQTQHGQAAYVMTQGANGVPFAVPAAMPTSSVVIAQGQPLMQPQNQQVQPAPVPQVVYPTPYTSAGAWAGAGAGAGAPGGQQQQPQQQYQTKGSDQPPAYQV